MTDVIGPGRSPGDPPPPAVPPLEAGAPPLAILIDYDGTISLNAVQRWNGQPASRQIRSRDRLANTMSL